MFKTEYPHGSHKKIFFCYIQGEFPCNDKEPFSLGHEFSGTVVDVGPAVKTFKKGDRVSVDPNK